MVTSADIVVTLLASRVSGVAPGNGNGNGEETGGDNCPSVESKLDDYIVFFEQRIRTAPLRDPSKPNAKTKPKCWTEAADSMIRRGNSGDRSKAIEYCQNIFGQNISSVVPYFRSLAQILIGDAYLAQKGDGEITAVPNIDEKIVDCANGVSWLLYPFPKGEEIEDYWKYNSATKTWTLNPSAFIKTLPANDDVRLYFERDGIDLFTAYRGMMLLAKLMLERRGNADDDLAIAAIYDQIRNLEIDEVNNRLTVRNAIDIVISVTIDPNTRKTVKTLKIVHTGKTRVYDIKALNKYELEKLKTGLKFLIAEAKLQRAALDADSQDPETIRNAIALAISARKDMETVQGEIETKKAFIVSDELLRSSVTQYLDSKEMLQVGKNLYVENELVRKGQQLPRKSFQYAQTYALENALRLSYISWTGKTVVVSADGKVTEGGEVNESTAPNINTEFEKLYANLRNYRLCIGSNKEFFLQTAVLYINAIMILNQFKPGLANIGAILKCLAEVQEALKKAPVRTFNAMQLNQIKASLLSMLTPNKFITLNKEVDEIDQRTKRPTGKKVWADVQVAPAEEIKEICGIMLGTKSATGAWTGGWLVIITDEEARVDFEARFVSMLSLAKIAEAELLMSDQPNDRFDVIESALALLESAKERSEYFAKVNANTVAALIKKYATKNGAIDEAKAAEIRRLYGKVIDMPYLADIAFKFYSFYLQRKYAFYDRYLEDEMMEGRFALLMDAPDFKEALARVENDPEVKNARTEREKALIRYRKLEQIRTRFLLEYRLGRKDAAGNPVIQGNKNYAEYLAATSREIEWGKRALERCLDPQNRSFYYRQNMSNIIFLGLLETLLAKEDLQATDRTTAGVILGKLQAMATDPKEYVMREIFGGQITWTDAAGKIHNELPAPTKIYQDYIDQLLTKVTISALCRQVYLIANQSDDTYPKAEKEKEILKLAKEILAKYNELMETPLAKMLLNKSDIYYMRIDVLGVVQTLLSYEDAATRTFNKHPREMLGDFLKKAHEDHLRAVEYAKTAPQGVIIDPEWLSFVEARIYSIYVMEKKKSEPELYKFVIDSYDESEKMVQRVIDSKRATPADKARARKIIGFIKWEKARLMKIVEMPVPGKPNKCNEKVAPKVRTALEKAIEMYGGAAKAPLLLQMDLIETRMMIDLNKDMRTEFVALNDAPRIAEVLRRAGPKGTLRGFVGELDAIISGTSALREDQGPKDVSAKMRAYSWKGTIILGLIDLYKFGKGKLTLADVNAISGLALTADMKIADIEAAILKKAEECFDAAISLYHDLIGVYGLTKAQRSRYGVKVASAYDGKAMAVAVFGLNITKEADRLKQQYVVENRIKKLTGLDDDGLNADQATKVRVKREEGLAYIEKAISILEDGIAASREEGDKTSEGRLLITKASILSWGYKDYVQARDTYRAAFRLLGGLKDLRDGIPDLLTHLGYADTMMLLSYPKPIKSNKDVPVYDHALYQGAVDELTAIITADKEGTVAAYALLKRGSLKLATVCESNPRYVPAAIPKLVSAMDDIMSGMDSIAGGARYTRPRPNIKLPINANGTFNSGDVEAYLKYHNEYLYEKARYYIDLFARNTANPAVTRGALTALELVRGDLIKSEALVYNGLLYLSQAEVRISNMELGRDRSLAVKGYENRRDNIVIPLRNLAIGLLKAEAPDGFGLTFTKAEETAPATIAVKYFCMERTIMDVDKELALYSALRWEYVFYRSYCPTVDTKAAYSEDAKNSYNAVKPLIEGIPGVDPDIDYILREVDIIR